MLAFIMISSHSGPGELQRPTLWRGAAGYLDSLCGAGPQLLAQDLLENIRKETDSDEQDDGQPGRATGQHLYEHIVHPLITEEWPGALREEKKTTRWQVRGHQEKH